MNALILEEKGSLDRFKVDRVAKPTVSDLKADQVIVKIQATALNPVDWKVK